MQRSRASFMQLFPSRTHAWRRLAFLLLLLVLGCSDEEEGCTLTDNSDGTWTLRCPDGSSARIHPAKGASHQGTVQGVATRLGLEDGTGTEVTLIPTEEGAKVRRTVTDMKGRYELEGVEPGIYHLSFRHPPYREQVRWRLPVLPGLLEPEPVLLRPSVHVSSIPGGTLIEAPTGDAFLSLEGDQGPLVLWEEATPTESTVLSKDAHAPQWLADGDRVLYFDGYNLAEEAGNLVLFERRTGRSMVIAPQARTWKLAGDGQSIVIEQTQGRLSVWRRGVSTPILGSKALEWDLSPDGRTVVAFESVEGKTGLKVIHWDIAAGGASVPGMAGSKVVYFSDDGRTFLFHGERGLLLWNGNRTRLSLIDTQDAAPVLSPDGELVLFQRNRPGHIQKALSVFRASTETVTDISSDKLRWKGFDPRTSSPLFVVEKAAGLHMEYSLQAWDPEQERVITLDAFEFPGFLSGFVFSRLTFPPGDPRVLYQVEKRAGERSLRLGSYGGAPVTLAPSLQGDFITVGGSHVLFASETVSLFHFESGETSTLTRNGILSDVGIHASETVHLPLFPQHGFSPETGNIGPLLVTDVRTGASHAVADEIWHRSCAFSESGALLCLSRRSPVYPNGSQLLLWLPSEGRFEVVAEGVLSFQWAKSGERFAYVARPRKDWDAPLLWVKDPSMPQSIPVGDEAQSYLVSTRWTAWSVEEGSQKGLHVSVYPRAVGSEENRAQ